MILITGKYEPLADCIAEKFRTMQNGFEVQVRNSIRLIEYLYAHDKEIEMLLYVEKERLPEALFLSHYMDSIIRCREPT